MGEKFSIPELAGLRHELLTGGLDSRDAAELLQIFLMGHGFGVDHQAAVESAYRAEVAGWSLDALRHELDRLAQVQ